MCHPIFQKCGLINSRAAHSYQSYTNVGVLANGTNADIVTTNVGSLFVPKTPETFTYDLDGNLTSDGHWTNSWDAENRLIQMEAISTAPAAAKQKLVFSYDYQGRRIRKVVYNWNTNTSAYYVGLDLKFLYDAWNLIAELNGTNNSPICSYMWGSDLSGSMQGAGGVGGLLCANHSQYGAHFPTYDGNGNVMGYVSAAAGTNSASYEYQPFGVTAKESGETARANRLRFSTKYEDPEPGFYYYGHRYLTRGRWLSRDPLAEPTFRALRGTPASKDRADRKRGDLTPYQFVRNDPVNRHDYLGLDADVTWDTAPNVCPKRQVPVFVQVAYGGFYGTPVVDDGSSGFGATGTGCPEYPNFGNQGGFQDSPGGIGTATTYLTALACAESCCGPTKNGNTFLRRINSWVAIVKWHLGDKGNINITNLQDPFEFADIDDLVTFYTALEGKYPNYGSCYSCYHKPQY